MQKFRKNWLRVYVSPAPIWSHYSKSLCLIDSFMILKQGWCPVNIMAITCQHYFEAELLSLNTMDILGWIILATGLSHALCDVHHHPWLLPLDRVETSLPTPCEVLTVRNVSIVKCPGGRWWAKPTVAEYITLKKHSLKRMTALKKLRNLSTSADYISVSLATIHYLSFHSQHLARS